MPCPHGTCASCCWHTMHDRTSTQGETWHLWRCWIDRGEPSERLDTTGDMEPPGCQSHMKPEK